MDPGEVNAKETLALRQELDVLDGVCRGLDDEVQRLNQQLRYLQTTRAYRLGKLVSLLCRPAVLSLVFLRRQVPRLWPQPKPKPADVDSPAAPALRVELKEPLPKQLFVGRGQFLYVMGWCGHSDAPVEHVQIVQDGQPRPVRLRRMGTSNHQIQTIIPPFPRQGDCSFLAELSFPATNAGTVARLSLQARLGNDAIHTHHLGDIELVAGTGEAASQPTAAPASVAICMTAFDPPLALFAKQVDSIRRQTHADWVCFINDDGTPSEKFAQMARVVGNDPRFRLKQNPERLGFYRNFERCLGRVPSEAAFVALSDHDDIWHPEKLSTLVSALDDPAAMLAYSDMRIVDAEGVVLSPTFWGHRRNNWTSLGSLLLANTVTGAASVFRRSLLDLVLPFPPNVSANYHDHWIACAALACGEMRFVDRPLHDYVQHGANVIGHAGCQPAAGPSARRKIKHWIGWAHPRCIKKRLTQWLAHQRAVYYREVLRIRQLAEVLSLRCGERMTRSKLKAVRRVAACDRSFVSQMWIVVRRLRRRGDETLGIGRVLATSSIWAQTLNLRTRLFGWLARRLGHTQPFADIPTVHGVARATYLRDKTAPLRLQVDPQSPRRVNILLPSLDFRVVFGGYIAKLALADALSRTGDRVRLVMVEECDLRPDLWRRQCRAYSGLESLMDRVELAVCHNRRLPLSVHPDDVFLATTWWTAHIADQAARRLGRERFVYLIQEYETFTSAMGAFAALADESYTFPHAAVFSTELLRDFFRQQRLGVFGVGGTGEQIAFRNAITAVEPPTIKEMADRRPRKVLLYARPDSHAARNMYELAILGLSRAVQAGIFGNGWEFYGIGAAEQGLVRLPRGQTLTLLPRHDQRQYGELLRGFDVGLALMYTPHPSLVPVEMASAGLVTVTNTFANKTAAALREISTNLVAVPATLDGVQRGLRDAVARADDIESRLRGSCVDWPTSWDKCFDPSTIAAVRDMLWQAGRPSARAA